MSTVAIYSGGMDSFTMINDLHRQGVLHSCLSFNYGQRHGKELQYARSECLRLHVRHEIIPMMMMAQVCMQGDSALTTDAPMPEGHYADDNMKQTVVPNRNMVMLSIAIAYAVSHKLRYVAYGAHSGDHTIYPDCRPEFVSAMNNAASLCDWHRVSILAPYLDLDKRGILEIGATMKLNYANSWTCYKGGQLACGKCGSCQERLEAFRLIGQRDPLQYEA